VEEPHLDRPHQDEHEKYESCGEDRRKVETEADRHPDGGRHPDRGCCCEAVDLIALAEDGAGAEEPNARDDLCRDAGGVGRRAKGLESEGRKETGTDSDEAQRLEAGRVAVELALEADKDREDRRDEKAQGEICVAVERQGS
jgi:hypothetical protein